MGPGTKPKSEEQKIQERITELETKIDEEQIYEKAEAYRNLKAAQDKNNGRIDSRDAQRIKLDAGLEAIAFVSPNDEKVRQEIDAELKTLREKASQIEREKADKTVAEAKARETAQAEQDKQLISRLEKQGFVVQRKPEQETAVAQTPSTETKKPAVPTQPAVESVSANQPQPQEQVKVFGQGHAGDEVKKLQEILGVEADGIFGAETRQALIAFQQKNGISADGVFGLQTATKIEAQENLPAIAPSQIRQV